MILSFLFRLYVFGSLPYQQPLSVTALSDTVYEKKWFEITIFGSTKNCLPLSPSETNQYVISIMSYQLLAPKLASDFSGVLNDQVFK